MANYCTNLLICAAGEGMAYPEEMFAELARYGEFQMVPLPVAKTSVVACSFETAWEPPLERIAALSAKQPGARFDLIYAEGGTPLFGRSAFVAGKEDRMECVNVENRMTIALFHRLGLPIEGLGLAEMARTAAEVEAETRGGNAMPPIMEARPTSAHSRSR